MLSPSAACVWPEQAPVFPGPPTQPTRFRPLREHPAAAPLLCVFHRPSSLHVRLPDVGRILSPTAGLPFFSQRLVCYPFCPSIICLYVLNADSVTRTVLDPGARRRHTRNEVLTLMKIKFWHVIDYEQINKCKKYQWRWALCRETEMDDGYEATEQLL